MLKSTSVQLVKVERIPVLRPRGEPVQRSSIAAGIARGLTLRSPREQFVAIHLGARSELISAEVVSVGTAIASLIHPREVFQGAILAEAVAIICAHNHPSGNPSPSAEDHAIYSRLKEAGTLLGIEVLDFLVVTDQDGYYSFTDGGSQTLQVAEPTPSGEETPVEMAGGWRVHATHAEETKAVRAALKAAGIKAKVTHGTGTGWAWLEINVGAGQQWGDHLNGEPPCNPKSACLRCRNLSFMQDEAMRIARDVTRRSGEYGGKINVLSQDSWNRAKKQSVPILHPDWSEV